MWSCIECAALKLHSSDLLLHFYKVGGLNRRQLDKKKEKKKGMVTFETAEAEISRFSVYAWSMSRAPKKTTTLQSPYCNSIASFIWRSPPPRATEDIIQFSQTKGVSMPEVSDNSTWSPLSHTFLITEFEGAASDIFLLQEVKVSRASLSSSPLFILYTVVCSVCTNVCDTLRDCLKVCTIISVAWLQTFEGAYSAELPDSLCNKLTSSVWYQAIESIYLLE